MNTPEINEALDANEGVEIPEITWPTLTSKYRDLHGEMVDFQIPDDFQPKLFYQVSGLGVFHEAMLTPEQHAAITQALLAGWKVEFHPQSLIWTAYPTRVRANNPDELVAVLSKQ